jgi:cobalt/nickel transport system permease protein
MHIAEGYLPAGHSVPWAILAAGFFSVGYRTLRARLDELPATRSLLGAAAGFCFVLSALKLPSVAGSSSHMTGVVLGVLLLGPAAMTVVGTVVLLLQALLLAHGGLSTLGANVVSMAVVGPFVGYAVIQALRPRLGVVRAAFVAGSASSLAIYSTTAVQLALAFPDAESGIPGSLVKFVGVFSVVQLPLALVEGIVTAYAVRLLVSRGTPLVGDGVPSTGGA